MSGLLDLTPILQIIVENPFLNKSYPVNGYAVAVIDTGYEGFVALPLKAFQDLRLDQLRIEKRTLILANGSTLTSQGAYGTLKIPVLDFRANGFIETYNGLEEIILGVEALAHFKLILDYCLRRTSLERC